MNKKIVIIGAVIIVLAIAYWLISPLWRNIELQEALPGSTATSPAGKELPLAAVTPIRDNFSSMDAETKEDFAKQTTEMEDKKMKEDEAMPPSGPTIISRAALIARAHDVEGEALFVTSGDERFLRFENLKTINGPDLRIYLGAGLSADDVVDLGQIRATEGNVNYVIPPGTDLTKYKNAMIWCRTFGILFSYAEL